MKIAPILFLLLTISSFSQQAVPASGGTVSGASGSFSVSVGQVGYGYYKNATNSVSQGVQQTYPTYITQVKPAQCGTILANLDTAIVADTIIGSQKYRFEVTNGSTVRTIEAVTNSFTLAQLSGGACFSTAYAIRVAVQYGSIWYDYGTSCAVTTPNIAPTASAQTLCASATVANLTATGTAIKWYAAASGETALATTTILATGTYYASQTINGCESSRTAVTISINDPQIAASATTVCSGTAVNLTASTTLSGTTVLPSNLQSGLIGYWPFTGNANDASGNGNNGTVTGATLMADRFGNPNAAYNFSGSNQFITCPNINAINGLSSATFSVWVKINGNNSWTNCSLGCAQYLISRDADYSSTCIGINYGPINKIFGGRIGANGNGVGVGSTGTYTMPQPNWHNIVFSIGGGFLKFYVDGVFNSSTTFNGVIPSSSSNLFFGKLPVGGYEYYLNGNLDDIAIYNRALTHTEVQELNSSSSYLWSTGETTATINPTPTATTTYWCDVTANGVTCRKQLTINVTPLTIPTFTQVAPQCAGTSLFSKTTSNSFASPPPPPGITGLPTTSNNGISGSWSPEFNNLSTTTYTFTPNTGQCAATTTMTIVIIESPALATISLFVNQANGCAPLTTQWNFTVPPNNADGTTYTINWGDGSANETYTHPVAINTLTHIYNTSSCGSTALLGPSTYYNTFQPTVATQNICSIIPELMTTIIKVGKGPTANFSSSLTVGSTNQSVQLSNTSDFGLTIPSMNGISCSATAPFYWTITPSIIGSYTATGLGSNNSNSNSSSWTIGSMTPSIIFNVPDTYTIALRVKNSCGDSTVTKTICIEAPLLPQFTLNATQSCSPATISTTNTTNISNSCNTLTYLWNVTYASGYCGSGSAVWNYINGTSANSANPSFNLVTPGTYNISVTMTNSAGSVTSVIQTVVVKKSPTVAINAIPNLCQTASFTAVVNGCAPTASIVTYAWSFSGGSPATSTLAIPENINFSTAGVHTVTLAVTNECGTTTDSKAFTINSLPTISGTLIACQNATSQLTGSATASATSPWTSSNTGVATVSSTGLVTGISSGTTTITYTNNNGCTITALFTVNPKTTPTFSQIAVVCSGTTIMALPTTSTNGITGTWSPALNNLATTLYTFTPTSGLCANTATMTITVNPIVTPTFTQVASSCANATMTALPTTSNNGISGTWSPALNNTTTTTYTFTPTAGQCANPTTQTITITAPKVTSAISFVAPVAALPSVTIGTQVWTNKNLDVTTYRDGTPIPQVTDPTAWANLTTGAWCYYNNDPANGAIYGKLYNWYAVSGINDNDPNTPNKILVPLGWHVPTDAEWTTLTDFLGGVSIAGNKMKEIGTTHWNSNSGATNSSGFTGLPGGYRSTNGTFDYIGNYGYWWSSSEYGTAFAWYRVLYYVSGSASRNYYNKKNGFSVRCLRD